MLRAIFAIVLVIAFIYPCIYLFKENWWIIWVGFAISMIMVYFGA